MNNLFVHAPFDNADVLTLIFGFEPPERRRVRLADHDLRSDASGLRVAPVPEAGAAVQGCLLAVTPDLQARADFVMAAIGAMPVGVDLVTPQGAVAGVAYRFEANAPGGEPPGGGAEQAGRLREMVDEVMGHYGRRDAAEMPSLMHGIGVRALGRARGALQLPGTVRLGSGYGLEDVAPSARVNAYARYFGVEEHLLSHRRFDGRMSPVLERAVFTSGDAVTVLPFDPVTGTVLLIEQFRAGLFARNDPHPWCLETVAGRCDRSEPPELTARREAQEEAGLELGRLEEITAYYPSPGTMSEYITAFVGEADLSAAGGTHGLAEEDEDIRALVVPLERAVAAALDGEINNAPLILSLLWLDRNAERLRAAWA